MQCRRETILVSCRIRHSNGVSDPGGPWGDLSSRPNMTGRMALITMFCDDHRSSYLHCAGLGPSRYAVADQEPTGRNVQLRDSRIPC